MAVNTIAPAFRAGCTVVLKPSPFTPVVTVRMGEILRELCSCPRRWNRGVVEALAAKARSVKVGNGLDEGTELGPINNEPQFERVKGLVAEAIAGGAVAAAGGAVAAAGGHPIEGDGYFFEPTILTNVAEGARIVDEEQFGPALPILTYRTVPEAIARANATNYGLGASVWSADPLHAAEVAEKPEAGTVWVNTHMQLTHDAPFTGMKHSGLGSEMGLWSIYAYTDPQTVFQARSQSIKKGAPQAAEAW
jgi:acyl-CoA reductase-like NAD-dependent aldehyde dehydrogenase